MNASGLLQGKVDELQPTGRGELTDLGWLTGSIREC